MRQKKDGEQKSLRLFGRFSLLLVVCASLLHAGSFEDFKREQAESFQQFKDERDSAFNKYLKEEFKAYKAAQGIVVYEKPKPKEIAKTQPIKTKSVGPKTIIKIKEIKHIEVKPPQVSAITKVKESKKDINFNFYGSTLEFNIPDGMKSAKFMPQSQKGISSFFESAASSEYEEIVKEISAVSQVMNLNDWGVYLLVLSYSDAVFSNPDESKLLSWFLFNKLGFNVKVGLANRHIVLMHYSKKTIYSTPNYSFDKKRFYVIANYDKGSVGSLYTYKHDYPDANKPLDLSIKTLPNFSSNMKSKTLQFEYFNKSYDITYKYNQNLIDFMASYPQADYPTYFNAPVDSRTYKSIAASLKEYIDGKQASDAMNFVLHFVQNAFIYQRDDQQFGREKVMFAEETLYYDKSDCEDRAVLYAYLVKELFGVGVIGLKYKDHMATALYVPMEGDSVQKGSKKFIVADPTYINANIGQSMPKYKNLEPQETIRVN